MTDPINERTAEEIQRLKDEWECNPHFLDIENTPGFEAHYEELKAWREDHQRQARFRRLERLAKNYNGVGLEDGLEKQYKTVIRYLDNTREIEDADEEVAQYVKEGWKIINMTFSTFNDEEPHFIRHVLFCRVGISPAEFANDPSIKY